VDSDDDVSEEKTEDVEENMDDTLHIVVRPGRPVPPGLEAAADLASGEPHFCHRATGRACSDPPTLQEEEERQLRIPERAKGRWRRQRAAIDV
jgi:hypothetical protein